MYLFFQAALVLIADSDELPQFQTLGYTRGMFQTNRFQAFVVEDMNEYCRVGLPSPHRPTVVLDPHSEPFYRILSLLHVIFAYSSAIETSTEIIVGNVFTRFLLVCPSLLL